MLWLLNLATIIIALIWIQESHTAGAVIHGLCFVLIQKTCFQFGFSVLWCYICIVCILMMFQVIWFQALYAPCDQNVLWITDKPVLTVWSERQVLPRPMRAVSGWTAAGRVQRPAHTWLRISRPAAQALLEVAHGRQGRRGGCGWRKRHRPWIMLIIKSPFWELFRHHIRFKCFSLFLIFLLWDLTPWLCAASLFWCFERDPHCV